MRLPPLKPDSDQMLHLDALRIVGAVMIVVFHFNRFINLDGRWQLADDAIKSFSLIVDLFFLISGYVMAAIYAGRLTTAAKYRDFLQKRVARLGPLHWATMGVFVIIAALGWAGVLNERDPSRYDVTCIPQNVLFIHAWGTCKAQTWNFVSWAISAEMGLYVALPLLFWDERLSTVAAERVLIEMDFSRRKRAGRIDSAAAAFILQGVLDRLRTLEGG